MTAFPNPAPFFNWYSDGTFQNIKKKIVNAALDWD